MPAGPLAAQTESTRQQEKRNLLNTLPAFPDAVLTSAAW
jgi:hypothetical protein